MSNIRWMLSLPLIAALCCGLVFAEEGDDAKNNVVREVKLESNGAEPRAVIKYTPTKGARTDMKMTTNVGLESMMGAMELPTIVVDAVVETSDVDDDNQFRSKMVFEDVKTEGEDSTGMGAMILGSLGTMKGLEIETVTKCNGEIVSAELTEIKVTDPSQRQMIDMLTESVKKVTVALPSEPVGVGAKWMVTESVTASGIKSKMVTTYEVVSMDAATLEMKHTIKQTAEKQTIQHPMGFQMEVLSYDGSGTGSTVLDLTTGLPKKATVDITTKISAAVDMGMDQPQPADQKVSLETVITTTPATVATEAGGTGDGADGEK